MTIDEAIEHAEEIACGNDQCAKDHAQLADWLRELRQVRIDIEVLKIFRDGFKEDAQKYKAENDRLRKLARDMHKAFFALDIDHCQACPRDTINGPCTKYLVGGSGECDFEEDMRELGVVD